MSLRIVMLASVMWAFAFSSTPVSAQAKASKPPKAEPAAAAKNAAPKTAPAAFGLERLAGENDLLFFASNGLKTPDPESKNKTDQLRAEKSVQQFYREVVDEIHRVIEAQSARGPHEAQVMAGALPVIAEAVIEHPFVISFRSLTLDEAKPRLNGPMAPKDLHLVIVLDAESNADAVREAFESIIAQAPEQGPAAPVEEKIAGTTFYHAQTPPQFEGVSPWFGMHKSYLILAMGIGEAETVVKLLDSPGKGPGWLQSTLNEAKVARPSSVFHLNVSGIMETVKPLLTDVKARGALEASGLMDLKRIASVTGCDPVFSVSKTIVETKGAPKGLLSLLPDKPLTADDLKGIPVNPAQANVIRFDLDIVEEAVLKIAEKVDPNIRNQYDVLSQQGEFLLGFSVRKDLLKSLGDVWSLYLAGGESGTEESGDMIAAVTVRDQKKLTKVQDSLVERLKILLAQRAGGLPAKLDEFKSKGGAKGYQIEANNVTVAWIIAQNQLVIGATSQSLNRHLARLDEKESLANNDEVVAALKRDPKTVLVSYHDPKHEIDAIYTLVEQFTPLALGLLQQAGIECEIPDLPPYEDIEKHLTSSVSTLSRTENGWKGEWQGVIPSVASVSPAVVAVGIGLMLPAVQQARNAAQRTQSKNNLKQIGLAMHNYESAYRHFPERVSFDKKGEPLLSWRVRILPFIDQAALYNEFHLDEPWDSEHNKKLIEKMPAVYSSPDSPELVPEFKTRYVVADAEGALFDGDEGPKISSVTDGTSNTIMVLEANAEHAVIWTKPDDLEIDFDDPLVGLISEITHGFHALLADGSVRFISEHIDPATLVKLITRAGGEVIGDF